MKKIFKTYIPIIITILFLFCYSFIISNIININKLQTYQDKHYIFIIIISILLGLLSICILAEIIIFIIHAANHKEIKNNILWVILIYILNIFIIPFYNIKYVINDTKYKLKTIIFIILMISSISLGFIVNNKMLDKYRSESIKNIEYNTFISKDNMVTFLLPNSYIEKTVGEYDIYFSDKNRQINMGVFTYNLDDYTIEEILSFQENYIIKTRDNVELIDSNIKHLSDKTIITHDYIGTIENTQNNYKLSIISFNDNPNYAVYVIQITLSENYNKTNNELEQILYNIKLNNNQIETF